MRHRTSRAVTACHALLVSGARADSTSDGESVTLTRSVCCVKSRTTLLCGQKPWTLPTMAWPHYSI